MSHPHQLRHAMSMATGMTSSSSPHSNHDAQSRAELAIRNIDVMKRLRHRNEELETQLAEAILAAANAEERASVAEAEAAQQRERMKRLAAEADAEISHLQEEILALEASRNKAPSRNRKTRRASFVAKFEDAVESIGTAMIDTEVALNEQIQRSNSQTVDEKEIIESMRKLVALSIEVAAVTKPKAFEGVLA